MGFHVLRSPITLRSYSSSLVGFFSKSHNPLLPARWARAGESSSMRCFASAIRGKNKKQKLDEACLERYQEYSRTLIQSWILQGKVLVDRKRASKAGMPVSNGVSIKITAEIPKYVCRGGLKLEAAIEKLDVNVSEKVVLDAGLSTGGFTDCLLRYGAAHVYGVDGQVADKIRNDKRVTVIERTNLRYLPGLPQKVDVVTLDLSFISILKVMPAVMNVMKEDATLVTLVKPQFEAQRSQVGRGGIVRDPKYIRSSTGNLWCKVLHKESCKGVLWNVGYLRSSWFHSTPARENGDCVSKSENSLSQDGVASAKPKRKKLKGKRAVVRWLKFFRWKKKKEVERMTAEENILNKLRKARKKEERLMETMKKLEPAESSETTHDPEILTPEEHFHYLKMGLKCKNYVPVGRRGIYQGVILNMHLHWKKHQTLQVVIKTFTPDEVNEIAVELARLTGGIVLDVHEGNTIIMYRGKNYVQPPTEIMSPRITLPRKKALDKSKCRDALRAVRKYIPRLEQELQLLQEQAEKKRGYPNVVKVDDETQESLDQRSEELKKIIERSQECLEDEQEEDAESELATDSDLSDIFETDFEPENEKAERPLFLEEFEKFPAINNIEEEDEDFGDPGKAKSGDEKDESPGFDEVDKIFLRAASLLKKKRR